MTITSTVNKNNYTGDGSQTIFSYTWLASSSSDIAVYLDDVIQSTGFTTSGVGTSSGGNVTFTTAPVAAVKVTLLRGIAYTQATDYTAYDPFPAETHESALDRGVIQAQQLLEKHDRTLKLKPSFSGSEIFVDAPTANKALKWDSTGTKVVNSTDDVDGITTAAAASATASATSATASATSATASATSATAGAASATAAAASYDTFDDRYLGAQSSDPTVDNDGNALVDGAMFFDTTNNITKIYDLGTTAWLRTTPTSTDQGHINTVSGIAANVTTVAGISAAVSGVNAISAAVSGVNAIAAAVSGVNAISGSVSSTASNSANINTVSAAIANVNTTAGAIANVNTVAGGITDINRYAAEYTIASSAPGSPSSGDLWYDSSATNLLKFYNGSAWVGIAPGITTEVDPNAAALALALG